MSSFIYPGDSKVKVNNFTTPRGLTFTGTGVSVTEDTTNNKFTITVTGGSGESNTASNVGTGEGNVFRDKTSTTLNLKTIKAGTNITVTDNADDITIAATDTGEVNTMSNLGSGANVFKQKNIFDFELRSIIGGTGLDATQNANDITLDIDSTVATLTGSQTLTNKTLTAPVISTISNTGTVTLPTATTTLVGRDTTDTLTNKTFNADGTGNSITNIENADIKAAAGIVYSKLTLTDSIVNADINSAAAIDTSKLADSANFLLTTNTKTVTNKTIDLKDNTVLNSGEYLLTVFWSGVTYYLRNNRTGAIVTSNTDALTVLQSAVDTASSNSGAAILVKAGTYLLSAKLNCIDKNFRMYGEGCLLTGNIPITNSDTVLKADFTGAAGEALIDCNNTVYNRQQFFDLVIHCNDTVDYGILAYDVRERYPWLYNVAVLHAADTGIRASRVVYTTCYNVVVAACANIGVQLYSAGVSVQDPPNTMYWYGGRFMTNGVNLQIDSSTDVAFNQVVLEGGITKNTYITGNSAKQIRFRDCSFEWHPSNVNDISCDDAGVNTTYDNCRFDSNNTTFYPITVRAAARQVQVINGKFQANNASTTAHITIESGAQDTVLIGNQQNTNTPMTVTVNDSGTRTVMFGNSFDQVRFTANTDVITLKDSTTNNAGDLLKNDGTRFTRLARGTANQFLKVNPGATDVAFAALDVTLDSTALTTTNTKTVTNKSVNISDNTFTATSRATGDLIKDNGTKYERFARGTLYGQVARVNKTQTDIEYARQAIFPSSNLYGTQGRRIGLWQWAPSANFSGFGLLGGMTVNGSVPGYTTFAFADGGRGMRFTPANTIGATNGYPNTVMTCRGYNPRLKARFRLNNKADTRFFIGFNNLGGILTTNDPLNTRSGIVFGKIDDATNSNFVIIHNDASGATNFTNVGPAFSAVAADNNIHTIEIMADDTNSKWKFSFDEGAYQDLSSEVPIQTTALGPAWNCETTNTTQPTYDIWWIEMESD